jgi:hypothetical protein
MIRVCAAPSFFCAGVGGAASTVEAVKELDSGAAACSVLPFGEQPSTTTIAIQTKRLRASMGESFEF